MITRRGFFKFLGLGVLLGMVPDKSGHVIAGPLREIDRIPFAPIDLYSSKGGAFDPSQHWGRAVRVKRSKLDAAERFLHADAKRVLSKGIPYELRIEHPDSRAAPYPAAWIYEPSFVDRYEYLRVQLPDGTFTPYEGPFFRKAKHDDRINPGTWTYLADYGCSIKGRFIA